MHGEVPTIRREEPTRRRRTIGVWRTRENEQDRVATNAIAVFDACDLDLPRYPLDGSAPHVSPLRLAKRPESEGIGDHQEFVIGIPQQWTGNGRAIHGARDVRGQYRREPSGVVTAAAEARGEGK